MAIIRPCPVCLNSTFAKAPPSKESSRCWAVQGYVAVECPVQQQRGLHNMLCTKYDILFLNNKRTKKCTRCKQKATEALTYVRVTPRNRLLPAVVFQVRVRIYLVQYYPLRTPPYMTTPPTQKHRGRRPITLRTPRGSHSFFSSFFFLRPPTSEFAPGCYILAYCFGNHGSFTEKTERPSIRQYLVLCTSVLLLLLSSLSFPLFHIKTFPST